MKVLVTGATGGLGELIISRLLELNIEVIATSRDSEKAKKTSFYNQVTYLPYDINQSHEIDLYHYFKQPDMLIHAAWEKLDDYKNTLHTTGILENHTAFLTDLISSGLKDITCIGTCYEYGLQEGVLNEDMPSLPSTNYATAKDTLRKHIELEAKKLNVLFKWIRVFYVFGEVKGRKNLYSLLMKSLENKETSFNMSGGEQIRDFLTPHQISEIVVKIALQKKIIGIINCCSGKPVKLKDFILDFLSKNNYSIKLNLGHYPYPDYEPMETWGGVEKLNKIENYH